MLGVVRSSQSSRERSAQCCSRRPVEGRPAHTGEGCSGRSARPVPSPRPRAAASSHSHPRAAALALALALGAWPLEADAAPTATEGRALEDATLPPEEAPAPPREDSYRGMLTASYVLAPFAAFAVGGALSALEVSDETAVLGASTAFLAPATIHLAHGNGYGPLSFFGMVGSTAAGLFLGGLTGHVIGSAGCDPAEDSDGCSFASINGIVYGALIGSVVGYTSFAIFDVTANGAAPSDDPRADRATLQLWVNPLPTPRTERAGASSPFGGLQLGATLSM